MVTTRRSFVAGSFAVFVAPSLVSAQHAGRSVCLGFLSSASAAASASRLECKDVLPGTSRLAVLVNPGNPMSETELRQTEVVARTLGLSLDRYEVSDRAGLDVAVNAAATKRPGGLLVLSDIMFFGQRARIVDLGMRDRLATIAPGSGRTPGR